MRAIKFRAWHETRGMVGNEKLVFWNGNCYLNESGTLNDPEKPHKPATLKGFTVLAVMQFTGLHDKNGKEIYEGDVVEWTEWGEGFGDPERKVRKEVKFVDGAFRTHTEFSVNENYLPIVATWGEVIGNIYENPDLLTKDKQP